MSKNTLFKTCLDIQDKSINSERPTLAELLSWVDLQRDTLKEIGTQSRKRGRLSRTEADLLRNARMFDIALPSQYGGLGLNSAEQARVLEELAAIDASISWCVMIGMDSGIYSGYVDEQIRTKYFQSPGTISAGWIHPQGTAVEQPNGTVKLNGRWQFGSGIDNANVILCGVKYFQNSNPSDKEWVWKIAVVDPENVRIEPTWDTWGLEGSGSQHYSVENITLERNRFFSLKHPQESGAMYAQHDGILRKMAGMPLGVARTALFDAIQKLDQKIQRDGYTDGNRPERAFTELGELTSQFLQVRASVYTSITQAWDIYTHSAQNEEKCTAALVTTALARQRSFKECRDITIRCGDLLGSQTVYKERGDIGARIRDLTVMNQHAVAQGNIMTLAGNRILGGHESSPFL